MDYVIVDGVQLDMFSESELRRLTRFALREHAERLQRMFGQRITTMLPDNYEDLISWILSVQRLHLEPMRGGNDGYRRGRDRSSSLRRVDGSGGSRVEGLGGMFGEGMVLAESHSRECQALIRRFPGLADAVVKEIRQGIRKFHDGVYGTSLDISQQKLAEDIYQQLCIDRPDSFWGYRDKFMNFSVAVGPISYAGSIPCFCYKVSYPQKWCYTDQCAWITVFFTLKETELRQLGMIDEPLAETRLPSSLGGDHVWLGDTRLPISTEAELRLFDRLSLRERADLLYRSLGDRVSLRPPDVYEDLVSWILRIQRLHLEELRTRDWERQSERPFDRPMDQLERSMERSAWRDAVVLLDGSRVPVFSDLEIRAMDRLALREHASLLSAKLGPERIGYGIPTLDGDLGEWIQQVQRVHLLPLSSNPVGHRDRFGDRVRVETDRFGDRVESQTYRDVAGEEVTKRVVTDRFGGEYEQTMVRDPITLQSRSGPRMSSKSPIRSTLTSGNIIDESGRFRERVPVDRIDGLVGSSVRPLGSRPLYSEDSLYRRSVSPAPVYSEDSLYRRSVSPARRLL